VRGLRAAWIAADGDDMDVDDDDDTGEGEDRHREKRPREEPEEERARKRARTVPTAMEILGSILPALSNDVVIAEILQRLRPEELLRLRQINRHWYRTAMEAIRTADSALVKHLTDDLLLDMPNLTSLDISDRRRITDAALHNKTNLKTLIAKRQVGITVRGLARLKSLTQLDLSESYLETDGAVLLHLPMLRTLVAYEFRSLKEENLQQLTQLTELDISKTRLDEGAIVTLVNLTRLRVSDTHVDASALQFLTQLRSLYIAAHPWGSKLSPNDIVRYAPGLTELGVEYVYSPMRFPLVHLQRHHWFGTTADHSAISQLPFKSFEFSTRMNRAMFLGEDHDILQQVASSTKTLLANLPPVDRLVLRNWPVDAVGEGSVLKITSKLHEHDSLTALVLDNAPITRAELRHIGENVPLREMQLAGTLAPVPGVQLTDFLSFTSLERLVIGPPRTRSKALAQLTPELLRRLLPNLRTLERLE
jgi:hypothetical protein